MKAKEKIITAAMELFEVNGYVGTTTAAIAKKAGVAEVTLFKNFKNKQNLFRIAIKEISTTNLALNLNELFSGDISLDLQIIAESLMLYFIEKNQTIRMLMFEAVKNQEVEKAVFNMPNKFIGLLSDYFEVQMANGILQKKDSVLMAKSFLSMIIGYSVFVTPFSSVSEEKSIKEVSLHMIDAFLNGVVLK